MNVVVLSGGLDSTVCMSIASQQSRLLALTFDYGQRHRIELERAAAVAAFYGAEQLVVKLDASQWGGSALTDERIAIPDEGGEGIPVTYVPARNLIFLSVAMGICEARDADAAYVVLNKPAPSYTGNSLLCEDVLLESGVTDLSVYDCIPGSELGVDLWVDSPNPPGYKGPY